MQRGVACFYSTEFPSGDKPILRARRLYHKGDEIHMYFPSVDRPPNFGGGLLGASARSHQAELSGIAAGVPLADSRLSTTNYQPPGEAVAGQMLRR